MEQLKDNELCKYCLGCEQIIIAQDVHYCENFVKVATGSARIFIDFSGTVDLNQEKNRLLKEEAACAKEVEFYKSKLSNDEFLKKAPAHVLEKQRAKLNAAIEKLEKTKKSLAELHCSE